MAQEQQQAVVTSQESTQVLSSLHMDFVHDLSFDLYGRRLATCSGDRFVRLWDLTPQNDWVLSGEWQAHKGSVTSLAWAHPEFGPLVATCGSDSDVKVWEEQFLSSSGSAPLPGGNPNTAREGRWVLKAGLTDARRAVTCCEFAPRQWGLKLAAGSADGMLRIYEAVDIMNLAQWPLQATLSAFKQSSDSLGVTCISWSTGRFEPPTLVAGGTHLVIYRYQKQWQPLMTLGTNTSDNVNMTEASSPTNVLDVAWAPNVGRRFHWIAAAHGTELRLYKLQRGDSTSNEASSLNDLTLVSSQVLETEGTVWKCQWNVTGTVLATSGDGGTVSLWKADLEGNWKCCSQIHGDLMPPPSMT